MLESRKMSRLTNKYDGVKEYYFKTYTPYCDCYKDESNKLGQFEDFEEEFSNYNIDMTSFLRQVLDELKQRPTLEINNYKGVFTK